MMIRNLLYCEKFSDVDYRKGIAMVRYLNEFFVDIRKLEELEKDGWVEKSGMVYEWF